MSYVFPSRQMLSFILQRMGLSTISLQMLLFLGCFYLMTAGAAWAKTPVKKVFATSIGVATPVSMCIGVAQPIDPITITEGAVGEFLVGESGDLVLDFGANTTLGGTVSVGITRNGSGPNTFTSSISGSKLTINYDFATNGNTKVITISGLTVQASTDGSYQLEAITAGSTDLNDLGLSAGELFATATVYPAVGVANSGTFYGPSSLFVGETFVFAVDAIANATQYQWTMSDEMNGAATRTVTTNVPFITLTATDAGTTGTITVKGISANSCDGADYVHNIVVKGVGLKANKITTSVCADGNAVTLPDIIISEQFFSDFKTAVTPTTFSLEFRDAGFTFVSGSNLKATFTSPDNSSQADFLIAVNAIDNTLEITYTFPAASEAELNTLVISGVQVSVASSVTAGDFGRIRFKSGFNAGHFTGITTTQNMARVEAIQGISRPTFNGTPPTAACTGQPLVINVNNVSGASGYNWRLPNGIVLNSSTDMGGFTEYTFDVNANAETGNIEVQSYNSNGCVSVWEVMNSGLTNSITVQTGPVKPNDIVGANELCLGSEDLYYIPAIPGADEYEWHLSSKLSSISDEGVDKTDSIINTSTNFLYIRAEGDSINAVPVKVRALKTGCAAGEFSNLKGITINNAAQLEFVGISDGQAFTTDAASVTLAARLVGTTANLTGGIFSGDGVSGGKFNPSDIDASAGAVNVPITYTYQVSGAPCPSVARVTVVVSESSGINGIDAVYCQGTDTTINFNVRKLLSHSSASILYVEALLLLPDGQGGQVIQSRNTNLGAATPGNLISSTPSSCVYGNAPASSNNDSLAYTFNPKGLPPGDYEIRAAVYNDFTLLISKGDLLPSSSIGSIGIGPIGIGPIGSTNGCRPSTQPLAKFKILETPASTLNSASTVQDFCADGLTEYTLSVPRDTTITYNWQVVDGGNVVGIADSNVVVVKWDLNNADMTRNIRLTESRATCVGSQLIPINVRGVPNPSIFSSTSPSGLNGACARSQVTYQANSGDNSNYTWTAVNGRVVSGQGTDEAVIEWFDDPNAELIVANTNANGCIGYDTLTVTVNSASAPNLQGPANTCAGTKGVVYTIAAPGTAVIEWSVSGHADTTTSANKDSLIVDWGAGPVGEVSVQKTLNGCVGRQEIPVAINALPVPSINNVASVYCNTQASASFVPIVNGSVTLPTGTGQFLLNKQGQSVDLSGYVSSAGVLDINLLNGDNTNGGVGNYELYYAFTNDAGCVDTSSVYPFELISKPTATFSGLAADYCANGDFIRLTGSPAGGFFTINELDEANGDAVLNTTPFSAGLDSIAISDLNGPGKYSINYTFQNSSGCQDISGVQNFRILTLPTVTIDGSGIQSSYCVREATDLSLAAFVDATQINSFNVNNSFFEVRRVSGSKGATPFEKLVRTVGMTTSATNLFSFTQPLPSETALTNTATTSDWNQLAGTYQVQFTYVDGNNCTVTSATQDIVIDRLPELDFSGLGSFYCLSVNEVQLTPTVDGVAPTGGTGVFQISSDSLINYNNFTPATSTTLRPRDLSPGKYFIRYAFTFSGTRGCTATTLPKSVTIGSAPKIDFSFVNPPANNKYCIDGANINFLPDSLGGFFTITKNGGGTKQLSAGITTVAINTLEGEGTYDVTYTYTDASGCTGTSDAQTFKVVPLPSISVEGLNNSGEYCVQNTAPIVLSPKIFVEGIELTTPPTLNDSTAYFEIKRVGGVNGFMKLVQHGTTIFTNEVTPNRPLPNDTIIGANATTEQWNARAGEYAVRYTYRDTNSCQNISAERIITLTPLPKLSFTGLSSSYCDDVDLVTLTPFDGESRITSSVIFKYRNITDVNYTDFTQGNSFSPKALGAGEYEIILESGVGGCQNVSNRDSIVTVKIEPTPKNIRIVASRDFNSQSINFSATADGVNNAWTWAWDFKDGTTSNEQNPAKLLSSIDPQVINYELIPSTELNCNASVSKRFKIDFDFTGHCAGGATQFTNLSELPGDTLGSISWDFGDGQGTSTDMNPAYTYQNPGTYWVTLSIQTKDGVATYKLRRRLDIFPVVTVNTGQFYVEGFNNGAAGWISHGVVDVDRIGVDSSSWALKNPDGFIIRNANGNAWVTDNRSNPNRVDTNANYNSNEQSYVESPCFNIGGLNKPMISFRYWSDTDFGSDGVTLLYTIDDGKTWSRLGTENLGINWYNTKPILGAPGDGSSTVNVNSNPDSQGWSGEIKPVNGEWQVARYSLTEVLIRMEQLGITSRVVRFRMAFGSNADNPPNTNFDGFAFDDVIISNRNRLVLLEYFINTGVTNAAQYDQEAKDFPQTGNKNEIVKIHHHTAFPAVDPLNEANPKDPSARAFHHGIREVPRGVVDGYFRDELIGQWTQDIFADRTLIPSPFTINVTNASTSGGQLNISTQIDALLAFDRKIVINVVVVDTSATANGQTYYNVTRKMLPDAAGTYRDTPWTLGESQTLNLSWDYGSLDPGKFKIIVFIEDYETKEIWQAGIGSVSTQRTQAGQSQQQVTSVEDNLLMEGAVVYPNPTTNRLNVAIKAPLSPKAKWQILSVTGRLVKQGSWTQGKRRISIDVQDLAGGVYILNVADKDKSTQLRFEKH